MINITDTRAVEKQKRIRHKDACNKDEKNRKADAIQTSAFSLKSFFDHLDHVSRKIVFSRSNHLAHPYRLRPARAMSET